MARPQKVRRVAQAPSVSGFKPYGGALPNKKKAVFLLCEEYEALRLNDYEKYNQCEAAAIMQISRPTFTRIYISAREKIATAFVEGRQIIVEGGKVEYEQGWYACKTCGCLFSQVEQEAPGCALCGSREVEPSFSSVGGDDALSFGGTCGRRKRCRRNRMND